MKNYVKPMAAEIEVAANCAVAACSLSYKWQNYSKRHYPGYGNKNAALEAAKSDVKHDDDPDRVIICKIYRWKNDSGWGYWEDWDGDGVYSCADDVYLKEGSMPEQLTACVSSILES